MKTSFAQKFDTGWYTANPEATSFTISTAAELAGLAKIVNGDWDGVPMRDNFLGKIITLIGNIDLSGYDNWEPIGNGYYNDSGFPKVFSGIFDGGGHVISNLTINRPDKNFQGLFGDVRNGSVENLRLDNVNIIGDSYVGSAAGILDHSSLINCHSTGVVCGTGSFTGGIAGNADALSSVDNCCFAGTVSGVDNVGGVAGGVTLESVADNCYSACEVSGSGCYIGGVTGIVSSDSSLANCYSIGMITGDCFVGGIAGCVDNSSAVNCAALGPKVKGNGWAGRVIGFIDNESEYEDDEKNENKCILSNNAAYAEMTDGVGNIAWNDKGANKMDGEDITAAEVVADGTIGGRFTDVGGWVTGDGKLPGFDGAVTFLIDFNLYVC